MNATPTTQATTDAPKPETTKVTLVETPKATSTTKPAAKKATPAKKATTAKAPAKKATAPAKKAAAVKKAAAPKVMASSDANHQLWQTQKKELTTVMADLLYDSRRVNPDHSKSQEEATAKVTAALKVLKEFTDSIRIKK